MEQEQVSGQRSRQDAVSGTVGSESDWSKSLYRDYSGSFCIQTSIQAKFNIQPKSGMKVQVFESISVEIRNVNMIDADWQPISAHYDVYLDVIYIN